jgi:hypothetical protein
MEFYDNYICIDNKQNLMDQMINDYYYETKSEIYDYDYDYETESEICEYDIEDESKYEKYYEIDENYYNLMIHLLENDEEFENDNNYDIEEIQYFIDYDHPYEN